MVATIFVGTTLLVALFAAASINNSHHKAFIELIFTSLICCASFSAAVCLVVHEKLPPLSSWSIHVARSIMDNGEVADQDRQITRMLAVSNSLTVWTRK